VKNAFTALVCFVLLACRGGARSQAAGFVDAEGPASTDALTISTLTPQTPVTSSRGVEVQYEAISRCLVLTPHPLESVDGHVKVELEMKALSSIGVCGCTSALLQFTALEDIGSEAHPRRVEQTHGTFDSRQTNVTLDLGTPASYGSTKPIVRIGCAAGP
jgi:hypothetical protein